MKAAIYHAKDTGEPIIRHMEYAFPHTGLASVKDQFMLGSDLLVAPVIEKGAAGRKVFVPVGKWTVISGACGPEIDSAGEEIFLESPGTLIVALRKK